MNLETENNHLQDSSVFAEPVEKVEKKKMKFLPIILFLLLLILGSFTYIFLMMRKDEVVEEPSENDPEVINEEDAEGPIGEIYLTLSPLGTEKENIYKLDVESMELEEFFPDSEYRNFMAKFSPDGEKMVFVRQYEDEDFQILLMDVASRQIEELTDRTPYRLNNPLFSPEGTEIVYWVYEGEDSLFGYGATSESHSIYVVNINGEKEMIASGVFPLFIPNGEEVLFMKTDGLYTVNLETKDEEKALIWDEDDYDEDDYYGYIEGFLADEGIQEDMPTWTIFRFNICSEGKYLIVTNTLSSDIVYFEILSWKPFKYNLSLSHLSPGPNWPVFSPDGQFLALQVLVSLEEDLYSWIEILDVESSNPLAKFNLDTFEEWELQSIWVTDWIVK